jgi:asparagine synthase (glutamine-hydrolysing)
VAVTPEWAANPSPELPRAVAVAEHLGIEHRVMYLDEADLLEFVPRSIRYFGGPIRDYHMIMLAWVYDQVSPEGFDLVLHGQSADTFFGAQVLGFAKKFGRKRDLVEAFPPGLIRWIWEKLPETTERGRRLGTLLEMDRETVLFRNHRLLHRKALRQEKAEWLAFRNPRPGILERVLLNASEAVRIQMADFYQGTISHMVTSTAISTPEGISMGYPFLTPEMLDLARRLPDAHKRKDGEAKPVLKALGARFFPAEWMKAPKLGFPTPTIDWLQGALAPWIEERLGPGSLSRALLGSHLIEGLRLPDDYELIWTLSNLEEFLTLAFPGVGRETIQVLEP